MTENLNFDELKIPYDADIFKLNRYSNILPYKHSMVSLTNPDQDITSKTDRYINANFIYNPYTAQQNPTWIATQGPMPVTYGHFWRMIWQQNVRKVLMLNGCSDEGKSPDMYFPENSESEPQRHADFEVSITEFHAVNQFYHTRELELKNLRTSEIRRLTHYNVVGWPDKKTPPVGSTDLFEELLNHFADVGID
jgi:protein tyrosine phosphatase